MNYFYPAGTLDFFLLSILYMIILDKFAPISPLTGVDAETCTRSHRCRPELLLFLCNQLSEQDARWDGLLTDAKRPLMLRGEVK